MNPVSVLRKKAARSKAVDRGSRPNDEGTGGELISILSYLEADNKRLWQAVQELSIETAAIRRALKQKESSRRAAEFASKDRPSRSCGAASPKQTSIAKRVRPVRPPGP